MTQIPLKATKKISAMNFTTEFLRLTLPIMLVAWLLLLFPPGLPAAETPAPDEQTSQESAPEAGAGEQEEAGAAETGQEAGAADTGQEAGAADTGQEAGTDTEAADTGQEKTGTAGTGESQPGSGQNEKPEPAAGAAAAKADVSTQIESSMATIETIHKILDDLTKETNASKEDNASTRSRMQSVAESLKTIDQKLLEAYNDLENSRSAMQSNVKRIDALTQDFTNLSRDLRANSTELNTQKSLIEDNSIRLYELLIQLQQLSTDLTTLSSSLTNSKQEDFVETIKKAINVDLNRLWLLLSTVLVFFAPLAFVLSSAQGKRLLLADGTDERQGMILACLGVFLGYFILGFGLMYGTTASGWVGIPSHLWQEVSAAEAAVTSNFNFSGFVLYKTGFAMFAALIVYTAAGSKLTSVTHMLLALFVGAILIPVYGHWATSGHFITTNQGWLQEAGFVDQAGAITINTVAGWFAFIICWKMGNANADSTKPEKVNNDPVYSSSATLLLWLSWMGFTTGTLPISNDQISSVMLNAGLAASAGGLTAFLQYVFFSADKSAIARGLGGFVSGLVAIAACAQSVTFIEAAFIGAVAGSLQNIAYKILRKWFLIHAWQSRAAYLVAIHGVAGIWGALCFALLGAEGSFTSPNIVRLATQLQGVAVAVIYSIFMANIAVFLLRLKKKAG